MQEKNGDQKLARVIQTVYSSNGDHQLIKFSGQFEKLSTRLGVLMYQNCLLIPKTRPSTLRKLSHAWHYEKRNKDERNEALLLAGYEGNYQPGN